jgi:ferritin-like metal-binding protein YciE
MSHNLTQLLAHEIQDLVSAEEQILATLPNLVDQAEDAELKEALEKHLTETRTHEERLREVAKKLGVTLNGQKCKGITGILAEGKDLIGDQDEAAIRDAAIIASAQRVEHYEMAAYGTAVYFARVLGAEPDVLELLNETLNEEKQADSALSQIANRRVNPKAAEVH